MATTELAGVSFRYPSPSDFIVETAHGPIRVPNKLVEGSGSVGEREKAYLKNLKQNDPSSLPTVQELERVGAHIEGIRIGRQDEPSKDMTIEDLVRLCVVYRMLGERDPAFRNIFEEKRRTDQQKPKLLGTVIEGLNDGRIIRTIQYYEGAHPQWGTVIHHGLSKFRTETVAINYYLKEDPFREFRDKGLEERNERVLPEGEAVALPSKRARKPRARTDLVGATV